MKNNNIVGLLGCLVGFALLILSAFVNNWYLFFIGVAVCITATGSTVWMNEREWRKLKSQKIKMYCLCSKEALDKMKGIRGKMITQGGHAYLHAFWDAEKRFPNLAEAYRQTSHAYKITLVVPTEDDLRTFQARYHDICGVSLVKDAGFTVFKNEDGTPNPTVTYLGLGPIPEDLIGDDLRALKTLS